MLTEVNRFREFSLLLMSAIHQPVSDALRPVHEAELTYTCYQMYVSGSYPMVICVLCALLKPRRMPTGLSPEYVAFNLQAARVPLGSRASMWKQLGESAAQGCLWLEGCKHGTCQGFTSCPKELITPVPGMTSAVPHIKCCSQSCSRRKLYKT